MAWRESTVPRRRLESRVRFAGAVGWAAAWALLLVAAGGAADARGAAILLGAPSFGAVGLSTAAVALLAMVCGRSAGRALIGLAPLFALLLVAAPLPGLRALTGPPLFAIAAAGAVLVLAVCRRRPPAAVFLPVVLALYGSVSLRVQSQVGPEGDEPHYLMVADSLIRDGDVSLEQDYLDGRYRAFHPGPLQPHYRVRGRDGAIHSLHALGLSLLILPAYALGGYPAVSLFMAGLAGLLAREVRELVRGSTGEDGLAEGAAWIVALSPPLVHYAGLVFTEVPAALLVAVALRRVPGIAEAKTPVVIAWGAAVSFLPWLNVRYALLGALLLLYALSRRPDVRRAALLLAPMAASGLALAAYHWALYGFFDPRLVYGRHPEFSAATLPEGVPGLMLDQEFGLLVYAPVLALAVPGFVRLWRARRGLALAGGGMAASVVLVAGSWHMWRGGFNPPGRFLVPVLPILAVATAFALRRGVGAAAALAIGWGLWTGLSGAWEPRLVHRDRDGTAPLFRAASGAEEWTRLLPAYVLGEPDRHRLAAVWAAALGAVAVLATRTPRAHPGALGAGWAGLALAAAAASSLSDARTGGRDAVRVVGRPALQVPRWIPLGAAPARWGAEALGWGPLYEPHRHPDGAPVGVRLPLPPGAYRLTLEADDLAPEGPAADLEARVEGSFPPRRTALRRVRGGFEADLEALPGERSVTLVVRGGGPFLLEELRLEAQPSGRPPVQSDEEAPVDTSGSAVTRCEHERPGMGVADDAGRHGRPRRG